MNVTPNYAWQDSEADVFKPISSDSVLSNKYRYEQLKNSKFNPKKLKEIRNTNRLYNLVLSILIKFC